MRLPPTMLIRLLLFFMFATSACDCGSGSDGANQERCVDCVDVCDPNPCTGANRECVETTDGFDCTCGIGTVEEEGACVAADACSEDVCAGREASQCVVRGGVGVCECLAGHHEEAGRCVVDTDCVASTCSMRGMCDASTGTIICTCDPGYAGQFCESCDESAGLYDDGNGGCTNDPCSTIACALDQVCEIDVVGQPTCRCAPGLHEEDGQCVEDTTCGPDSCNGHGVCDDAMNVISCTCEMGWTGRACDACDLAAGFHDDGAGGCTLDPCLPNPCMEPNKSVCSNAGQQVFCGCDPGFHDEGGSCVANETCQPNSCSGHGVCDDSTFVTVCTCDMGYAGESCDQCDTNLGYRPDGTGGCTTLPCTPQALPDDGFDCTVDTCPNGVAVHTPDHTACDDGLWCTGVETCAPADPSADARGCVVVAPVPGPSPGPCQFWGACDEASQSFPLMNRNVGDPCSDGIHCTSSDTCDANGACTGQIQPGCPGTGACTTTTTFAAIDIPQAHLNLAVTYDGQDPVLAGLYGSFDIFAVDQTTGTWTRIANYYGYGSTDTIVYAERILPGIYDIMYVNTSYGGDITYQIFNYTDDSPDTVYGMRVLQEGVVFRAGQNTYALDVPQADLNLTVTYAGEDPVVAQLYGSFDIFAVDHQTQTWTRIANYYGYGSTDTIVYAERLLPGTYDIMYVNTSYGGDITYKIFNYTDDSPDTVYGMRFLQRDVVIGAGPVNLVIDIPQADLNLTVTYDGQDPVAAQLYGSFDIFAVDHETETWTRIANYYGYGSTDTIVYGERLLPGTYDIMYVNTSYGGDITYKIFNYTDDSPDTVYGMRFLQRDVVIGAGPVNLTVDVPQADLNLTVTYDGQDPVAAQLYGSFDIFAVDHETDTWTRIANYYGYGSTDTIVYGERLLPGTYDLMYVNTSYGGDITYKIFNYTDDSPDTVYGMRFLRRDVVIGAGPVNLTIDVPQTDLDLTVTYKGQDPVVAQLYGSFDIFAVDHETDTWTRIANYYGYGSTDTIVYAERLLPGTYDFMYVNTSYGGDITYEIFNYTDDSPDTVYGMRFLQRNVAIGAGPQTLTIDIPESAIAPVVTYDGVDPVAAQLYGSFDIFAVDRETRTWTRITNYYGYGSTDTIVHSERILPGVYDLMYVNTSYGGDITYQIFNYTDDSPDTVYGMTLLQQCVLIP